MKHISNIQIIQEIRDILDLVEQMPSGVDYDASELDKSPYDMIAHICGLIWQKLNMLIMKN